MEPSETVERSATGRPEKTHRFSDGVALGLLGAYLVSRQVTQRLGLAWAPKLLKTNPWVIPLLNNSSIVVIQAGVGTPGRPGMFVATMLASMLISTIVGLIMYWAGWRFGHRLAETSKRPGSPWATVWNPKQIARAERWMDRWGMIAVFLARATEFFTLPINLVAGASEMRFRRFLLAHTLGAAAFAGLFLWIGAVAQSRWPWLDDWIADVYGPWALRIGLVLLVLLVVVMLLGPSLQKKAQQEDQERSTTTPSQPPSSNPPEND